MDDSRLIDLMREHPCIFNPKHHLYVDANVRDNVWSKIALKMKILVKVLYRVSRKLSGQRYIALLLRSR